MKYNYTFNVGFDSQCESYAAAMSLAVRVVDAVRMVPGTVNVDCDVNVVPEALIDED